MAKSTVEVEIVAEIQKATKAVNNFANNTQKQLSGISFASNVTAISTGFIAISNAASIAFNIVKNNLGSAINASLEAEQSNLKLAQSMRVVGDFSEEAVQSFSDFADELSRVTGISDETIKNAAALAKTFDLTNQEAKNLTVAAIDLSAATGRDLDSSIKALAQSYNGFIERSLGKLFPELKALTKEQLASGEAIRLVGDRFKGTQAIVASGFGGGLDKTRNAFDEILETLGEVNTRSDLWKNSLNLVSSTLLGINDLLKKSASISLDPKNFKGAANVVAQTNAEIDQTISLLKKQRDQQSNLGDVDAAIKSARIREVQEQELAKKKEKLQGEVSAVIADIEKRSLTQRENLIAESEKRIAKVKELAQFNLVNKQQASLLIDKERLVVARELQKAAELEAQQRAQKFVQDTGAAIVDISSKGELLTNNDKKAIAVGITASVARGAEGARKLITSTIGSSVANTFGNVLGPVVGPAFTEIVSLLSQGPEAVKETVRSFAAAIPEVIKNIAESFPVLIQELATSLPPALARAMPTVAFGFTTALIKNLPNIVTGFAKALVNAAGEFVRALIDSIKEGIETVGGLTKSVTGDKGFNKKGAVAGGVILGPAGALVGGIFGDELGFADGGRIPDLPKFSGDRFPARLSAGEQIFSKDLSNRLETFLQAENSGRPLVVNLVVGEQQLAQSILNLNRRGFRTA